MKYVISLIWLLTFVACKKNEDNQKSIEFLGEYENVEQGSLDKVKMYTKDGIVTDATVIIKFLNSVDSSFVEKDFIFKTNFKTFNNDLLHLNFSGSQKVTVKYYLTDVLNGEYAAEILSQSTSEMVIKALKEDTLTFLISIFPTPPNLPPVYISKLISTSCVTLPSSSGYLKRCISKQLLWLTIKGNDLYLTLISSLILRAGNTYRSWAFFRDDFNILNTNISSQLSSGDTVILQTKTVKIKKK